MTFMLARRGATILRRLTSQCPQNIVCASIRDQNEVLVTSAVAASPLRLMKLYSTPVARPKAHTGRAAASKKARSGESKTATDNSEKKSKKTTKSKKETTGSKKKIKTVKSATRKLTDKQKEERAKYKQKQEIKQLKVAMLSPPKTLPNNAFGLVLQQTEHGTVAQRTEVYRGLSAAEREVCAGTRVVATVRCTLNTDLPPESPTNGKRKHRGKQSSFRPMGEEPYSSSNQGSECCPKKT